MRYQNGLDSYVNVITAQNAFLTNRLGRIAGAAAANWTASIALINNLGGGWSTSQRGATEALAQKRPDQGNQA